MFLTTRFRPELLLWGIAPFGWHACPAAEALIATGDGGRVDTLRLEAESVVAPPFVMASSGTVADAASGGAYVEVPEGSGDVPGAPATWQRYDYTLEEGGDVAFWARVWTPDAGSDSFWYDADGGGGWQSWEPGEVAGWAWKRIAIAGLESGDHTFRIAHQEDGVRIDRLLFSSDLNRVPGNGLKFLGDTGGNRHYVEVGGGIVATEALTLEAWVKFDAIPAGEWDPIVAKGNEWALLRYRSTDKLVFRTGGEDLVSLRTLEAGRWYHVAATFSGGTKRLYIDGVLDRSVGEVAGLAPGPAALRFGANVQDIGGVFRGSLDEVRVWSVARTQAEIAGGSGRILRGGEAGLEGYWRFEGDGDAVIDASRAGRDGTLEAFVGRVPLRTDGVELTGPTQALRFVVPDEAPAPLEVVRITANLTDDFEGYELFRNDGAALAFDGVAGEVFAEGELFGTWVGLEDLNRDGNLDLVVVGRGGRSNVLYLGRGGASPFEGSEPMWLDGAPADGQSAAFGDFNGDGYPDLAVANANAKNYTYLNTGGASPFDGVLPIETGEADEFSTGVVVGDLNGDGRLDAVTANYSDPISVFMNGFAFSSIPVSRPVYSVALADLNGDGRPDLITGVEGSASEGSKYYLNQGGDDPFGGVVGQGFGPDGYATLRLAVGDVNGDGAIDLVAGNQPNDQHNQLFLSNGTADPFAGVAGQDLGDDASDGWYDVTLADIDGDGNLDLLTRSSNFGDPLRLYLNNGSVDAPFVGVAPVAFLEPPGFRATAAYAVGDVIRGVEGYARAVPGDDSRFNFSERCTFEFWVRPEVLPSERVPLLARGAAWGLYLEPGGAVSFETVGETGSGTVAEVLTSDSVLVAGDWTHVAATVEAVDGLLRRRIFIGGAEDAVADSPAAVALADAEGVPTLGGSEDVVLRGAMDEVRIWDQALPGATIAAQSTRNLNGREPGLLALWRFDTAEAAVRNSALNGASSDAYGGEWVGDVGMEAHFTDGVALGPPLAPQFDLFFDGGEFVEVAHDAGLNFGPALTVEVWVKPTEQRPSTVLVKGSAGYGLGLDVNLRPVFFEGGDLAHTVAAGATLPLGEWSHVAVVVENAPDGGPNGRTTFFINGQPAGVHSQGVIVNNGESLFIGKGGAIFPEGFVGEIDEVRLWGEAVTPGQIGLLAQVVLPDGGSGLPGLEAYWAFDEGTGLVAGDQTVAGRGAELNGMDESNWRFGHDFGVPPLPDGLRLTTSPASAGLWIGDVVLDAVNEVAGSSLGSPGPVAATGDTAAFRILLHVDDAGRVRLLKDVIVMRKREDPDDLGSALSIVLVTEPELVPNFEGVVPRGGKLVGVRYGTVGYDFVGNELQLLGGVGPALGCAGSLVLSRDHRTNPFRHKFHPQHREGYTITRAIGIDFDGEAGGGLEAGPGYGVERISGTYEETVTGLHKIPIRVRGRVDLTRISDVGVLNE